MYSLVFSAQSQDEKGPWDLTNKLPLISVLRKGFLALKFGRRDVKGIARQMMAWWVEALGTRA